jgi:4'-phosphopantetheinyl transferase
MRASFAPLEWSTIRSHATPAEQLKQFFVFWTLKESFIKNIGIGLGLDLERMEFYYVKGPCAGHYDEVRLRLIPKGDEHDMDTSDYRFHHFPLDATHAAAVCVGPPAPGDDADTPLFDASSAERFSMEDMLPSILAKQ